MKTSEIIGAGIIGAGEGSWALKSHIPALKQLTGKFTIVAVSTSNIDSARATAGKLDIPNAFDNEQELVNHPEVDLVVVAVKVPAHLKLVSAAIEAGKMVFCEWPLGNGLEEARKLETLARIGRVKTFCGLQAGSIPELIFLKEWLALGNLGKIFSTSVIGSGNNWGPVLESASLTYLLDPKNGGTMLTIPFAHFLNSLQITLEPVANSSLFLAKRNDEVYIANSGEKAPQLTDDQILFSGTLEGGIVFSVNFHGGEWPGINLLWEIYGSKGKITVKSPSGHIQFGKLNLEVAFLNQPVRPLQIPESYRANAGGDPGFDAAPSRAVFYAYEQIYDDISNGSNTFPDFSYAVRHHEQISLLESLAKR